MGADETRRHYEESLKKQTSENDCFSLPKQKMIMG